MRENAGAPVFNNLSGGCEGVLSAGLSARVGSYVSIGSDVRRKGTPSLIVRHRPEATKLRFQQRPDQEFP